MSAPQTRAELGAYIDHALLKPEFTRAHVLEECRKAALYQIKSVCVRPCDVAFCASALAQTTVLVGTVIGFPNGAHLPGVKLYEAQCALRDGARELDMVMHIPAAKDGRWRDVMEDIRAVTALAHAQNAHVKVILETCLLSVDEKIRACAACAEGGADFVKTSTGFAQGGATLEDIALLRKHTPPHVRVKASGGIRTAAQALAAIAAGADRLGVGAAFAVLDGFLAGEQNASALGKGY